MSLTNLRAALAARQRAKTAPPPTYKPHAATPTTPVEAPQVVVATAKGKGDITLDMLNAKQRSAVQLFQTPITATNAGSFVLDGSAGTGKTTTVRLGIAGALQLGVAGKFPDGTTGDKTELSALSESSILRAGAPRIVVVSYTNVAVRNIKEIMPDNIKPHCTSIHKLVGYYPTDVAKECTDINSDKFGTTTTTQQFIPKFGVEPKDWGGRGLGDGMKLPHIDLVIIEEAGTVPVYLYKTLYSALPNPERTRFIFLGDIEQLAPAFGDGIIGFKQTELPVITLDEVYRNVGLVTKFAQRILTGKPIGLLEATEWNKSDESGSITMRPFKKAVPEDMATKLMGRLFQQQVLDGEWHENTDVVIVPFNKRFGSIELNKYLMQGIVMRDSLKVQEVIAGFESHYLFIGARVMYNKVLYQLTKIEPNTGYTGSKKPFPYTKFLNMWGQRRMPQPHEQEEFEQESLEVTHQLTSATLKQEDVTRMLETLNVAELERSTQASHILHLVPVTFAGELSDDNPITLKSAADLNSCVLPYALTCHKAQGSEWQRVSVVMHRSHGVMHYREWLYTAVTRARRDLTLYYSDVTTTGSTTHASLTKAIVNQDIVGRTKEEKLEYFKKKLRMDEEKQRLKLAKKAYNAATQTTTESEESDEEF